MASTYTDNLGLEKQADGENSSTWGQKLNTLFDMAEDAVSEVLSKSIKEEEKNLALFNFLKQSIVWLDKSNRFSNFHIHFLI